MTERKKMKRNKSSRLVRKRLGLGLMDSRLVQYIKKSLIKYGAEDAAVAVQHLASASVWRDILSFLCSIITR